METDSSPQCWRIRLWIELDSAKCSLDVHFEWGSNSSPQMYPWCNQLEGGGPRVVVSTAAFHARVRGSVPGLGGLKETTLFLPHPRVKVSIVGSLRDREVACSASDRQGSNFESCVWRTVSSQSSHHPQEVLLAQFSLYVHKGGLKPDSSLSRNQLETHFNLKSHVFWTLQVGDFSVLHVLIVTRWSWI